MKLIYLILSLLLITRAVFADAVIFSGNDVKALKYNLDLFGRSKLMGLNTDPRAGSGIAAPLASIGMDYLTGSIYIKTTAPDTGWITLAGANVGFPLTFAGYDAAGNLGSLSGWNYLDNATQWRGADINKSLSSSVTDAQAILIRSDIDNGQTAGNFNGVNVTTNYGDTTPTTISNVTPFGVYGQVGGFATIQNLTAFLDNSQLIDGAVMQDMNSFVASPRINSSIAINSYGAFRSFANIGDTGTTPINSYGGLQLGATLGQFSILTNANSITSDENFQTGSQVTGYTGYSLNPQFSSSSLNAYRGLQLIGDFGQSSPTAVGSHIDIEINPNYETGSSLGQYNSISVAPNFRAGSDTSAMNMTMVQHNAQVDSSVIGNVLGYAGYGNYGTSAPLAMTQLSDMALTPHFGASLTLGNYYAMSISPNVDAGATVTGNVQMMRIGSNGTLPVAGNAEGLDIDMQNFQTSAMPQGLQVNNGSSQLNANFDTGIYPVQSTGGPLGLNNIGGQFHIAAGHPITGANFGIGNNLGIGVFFEDNFPVDSTGLDLGFLMNGFLTQVGGIPGATFHHLTFMGAGASIPGFSTGGTIDEVDMFRALGVLSFGGSMAITNMYGFKVDPTLTSDSPTNAWGIWSGADADNWFSKDVVIGGVTGKPTNSDIAFEIASPKAILGPVLTTVQQNALTPIEGMMIYNSDDHKPAWYDSISWVEPGAGTVTSVGFSVPASSIFTATGSPVTTSGTLGFTVTGVSGGIPYFDTTSTLHTSSILPANQLIVGGGAGTQPLPIGSTGTATTVLHGNAGGGPSFSAVALGADVSGALPIGNGGTGQVTKAAAFNALSPMTTAGDIIVGGASGTGTRLGVGTDGFILTLASGTPAWLVPTTPNLMVLSKSASYTLAFADNLVEWDTSGGSATATLPSAVGVIGLSFRISLKTAGNPLTIATSSGQLIGTFSTGDLRLATANDYITVVSDNSNWVITSKQITVHAAYKGTSGASVGNNTELVVNYNTSEEDPLSLVTTGSGWKMTAQYSGLYQVQAVVTLPVALAASWNQYLRIQTFTSGASPIYNRVGQNINAVTATAVTDMTTTVSTVVRMSKGDYMQPIVFQNTGSSRTLVSSVDFAYITIDRIGD